MALYHERWELELGYDEIKTHLLDRQEAIRSRTPAGVRQELWGIALAYNLVRLEMERAADMLERIRSQMGVTIIWVEHIMGVLMRVVYRVIVLDHGEKIFEGAPAAAAVDPRVTEVYLGKGRH